MQGHVSLCIVSGKRLLSAARLCCVITALLLQMLARLSTLCLYKFNKHHALGRNPSAVPERFELFPEPLVSALLIISCLSGCVSGMLLLPLFFPSVFFILFTHFQRRTQTNEFPLWSLLFSFFCLKE